MRNPLLLTLLILLALIPIAVWAYAAYGLAISYQAAEEGARKMGQAVAILMLIVAGLTPAFVGGILMLVGAGLLGRKPWGARITATIGIVLIIISAAVALIYEREPWNSEISVGGLAYVLVHAAVLVWLWRSRPVAAP
jgi:hypothetical protein